MTGDSFLRRSVDGKRMTRFESETSIFEFICGVEIIGET